ncbi:FtsK/SpoIIIE domain-containing protein [Georgenia sp. AZ-5]|uniref:FtsK/SpoIIIE domain-containing protein n=1 Tax=Georgenia sp. AZ-5 TaxID=3367526 RepID=UPI0037550E6E
MHDDPAAGSGRAPDPAASLRCAWHLAVVAGPDTGWCLPVTPGCAVGRAQAGSPLTDPLVSRRHLLVRTRRGRVQVRDAGSANGTHVARPRARPGRRRARRVGQRWRDVAPGDRLTLGGTVLELRARPTRLAAPATIAAPPPRRHARRDLARLAMPLLMCAAAVTFLLAAPSAGWRWATLVLPLGVLALALLDGRRRDHEARDDADDADDAREDAVPATDDPAALLLLAAAAPVPAAAGETLTVRLLPQPAPGRRRGARVVPAGPAAPCRAGHGRAPLLDLADGECVALVGARTDVVSTARWLLAQLVLHGPEHLALRLPGSWEWAAVLPHTRAAPARAVPAPAVPGRAAAAPAGPALTSRSGDAPAPLRAPSRGDAPAAAWCVTVREAWAPDPAAPPAPGAARVATLVLADRLERTPVTCTRVVHVPDLRGTTVSAAWAGTVAALLAAPGRPALPGRVRLAELLGATDDLGRRWAAAGPGLSAPLGADANGAVELDLAAAGPHALVAGTTGAGKSELLLSWLLALAVRYSPAALQLVLVDYKGGATFGALAALPHTAGVLTDLDPAATARALASLRAELRRRERLLAGAGARDLDAYRLAGHDGLPRLLVVVDEYRTLTDTHPDVLATLVRLAAQGRSLGLHLILATQRPGGAVGPDVRANLTARVCLRVLEPTDSLDVLGVPDAARLPALPGRALLRTDGLRLLQAAWTGPDGAALTGAVVTAARRAWEAGGSGAPAGRPWAEPLPRDLPLAALAAPPVARDGTPPGLPLARTDLPDEQRLGVWRWAGPALLVTGGPGTGRTEVLRAVVAQALSCGAPVHVVAAEPTAFADLSGPALGTVVGADDPRRVARLLAVLAEPPAEGRAWQVLVVDDVDAVCDRLDAAGSPGAAGQALGRLLREGRRRGVSVALSGPPSLAAARWAEAVRTRLVLAPRDETEALVAGVPRALVGGGAVPGRGVVLEPGGATAVQVARAAPVRLPGAPLERVPRLAPLPETVAARGLPVAADRVTLGLGGDTAGPVTAPARPGDRLLVVGPPGSGRTSALATAGDQLAAAGRQVREIARAAQAGGDVVVLDDLDRWPGAELDELDRRLALVPGLTVLAAARTEAVVAAFRGPLALWRSSASLLVLRPAHPGSGRLTDVDLAPATDLGRPSHPGRGVLVAAGTVTPVQVAR